MSPTKVWMFLPAIFFIPRGYHQHSPWYYHITIRLFGIFIWKSFTQKKIFIQIVNIPSFIILQLELDRVFVFATLKQRSQSVLYRCPARHGYPLFFLCGIPSSKMDENWGYPHGSRWKPGKFYDHPFNAEKLSREIMKKWSDLYSEFKEVWQETTYPSKK